MKRFIIIDIRGMPNFAGLLDQCVVDFPRNKVIIVGKK